MKILIITLIFLLLIGLITFLYFKVNTNKKDREQFGLIQFKPKEYIINDNNPYDEYGNLNVNSDDNDAEISYGYEDDGSVKYNASRYIRDRKIRGPSYFSRNHYKNKV